MKSRFHLLGLLLMIAVAATSSFRMLRIRPRGDSGSSSGLPRTCGATAMLSSNPLRPSAT